ncbi:MAG: hypothetical protein KGL39_02925 [Patescibacteria group bacterium]|nr:hypothetical protein [Patescibacteria group bacterium]
MAKGYYRVGQYYFDTAANVLYRCTVAGDQTSSAWQVVSGGGGFMGEYDKTKAYSSGQTFMVSTPTTIAGIAVAAGLYGVPPAGTDVLGRPWYGYVPANPTGNAVPQYPLPSLGAAPNDKYYANLIFGYCMTV